MSTSLSKGIAGHEVLAIYYESRKSGQSHTAAVHTAISHLDRLMTRDLTENLGMNIDWLTELRVRLVDYFNWCEDQDYFRIVEVETTYRVDLPTRPMQYAMRLDLLVEMTAGPQIGNLVIIDHKFVYDFYGESELSMNAQLPKYIGIVTANGHLVRSAILNQIRTRVNKKKPMEIADKFRRELIVPNVQEIRTIFAEELMVAERIAELRALPVDEWEQQVTRTMNNMTCKTCPFVSLCKTELSGQDTRLMREMDYEPITYGYAEAES